MMKTVLILVPFFIVSILLQGCGAVPSQLFGPDMDKGIHARLDKTVVEFNIPGVGQCSGVIVTSDIIMTVKHCVNNVYGAKEILINGYVYEIFNVETFDHLTSAVDGAVDGLAFITIKQEFQHDYRIALFPLTDSPQYRYWVKCFNASPDTATPREYRSTDSAGFHPGETWFDRPILVTDQFEGVQAGCSGGGIFDRKGVLRALYYGWLQLDGGFTFSGGFYVSETTLKRANWYIRRIRAAKRRK